MHLRAFMASCSTCSTLMASADSGIIGGSFVPVLMLVLWLGGAFGKKCPSPLRKSGSVTTTGQMNA